MKYIHDNNCFLQSILQYYLCIFLLTTMLVNDTCDSFEQRQAHRWVLTNLLNAMPLRPGSTFIEGFSRAIYQKISDFNSYPLRYQF